MLDIVIYSTTRRYVQEYLAIASANAGIMTHCAGSTAKRANRKMLVSAHSSACGASHHRKAIA